MKSLGLLTQFFILGLAVAISILYTKPALEEAQVAQSQIDQYELQRAKVSRVNADLAGHIATMESVSPQNIARLYTYAPETVDGIAVMRDIQIMAEQSGVTLKQISDAGSDNVQRSDRTEEEDAAAVTVTPQRFDVLVDTTYDQLKDLLVMFAQNDYPLEVHELSVTPLEGGFMEVSLLVITYAATQPVEESESESE